MAVCHDCRRRHEIRESPATWLARLSEWEVKHRGHRTEFVSPQRIVPRRFPRVLERIWERFNRAPWWLEYKPNANIKIAYAASAAYTITLASLASSATLTAGQESTGISNASNLYLDYMIGGKATTGTTPTTAKSIQIWIAGAVNDTPLYPDVMDGTDSAETVTTADIRNGGLIFLADTAVDATSNQTYWFRPSSLAAVCGGIVPVAHSLWVTHDTVAALHATAGNHSLSQTGIYVTSV